MTFEKAYKTIRKECMDLAINKDIRIGLAIELMKADAMQRQAEAIATIAKTINVLLVELADTAVKETIEIKNA